MRVSRTLADAMAVILRFLTARDILRMARTNKRLEGMCGDPRLWARLYREDFLASDGEAVDHIALDMATRATGLLSAQPRSGAGGVIIPGAAAASAAGGGGTPTGSSSRHGSGSSAPDPRTLYKTKFVERLEREQRARQRHLATVAENRAKLARLRCRPCITCVQTVCAVALPAILLFSSLACIVANLDAAFPPGDETPRPVPVPWWVMVLLAGAASVMVGVAAMTQVSLMACGATGPCRRSVCLGQNAIDSRVFVCGLMANELCEIDRAHRRSGLMQVGCVCLVALAAILAPVSLLIAAASAAEGGPHFMSAAVAPLYVLMCVVPMGTCRTSGVPRIKLGTVAGCMGIFCCVMLPLAVVVGLAAAKADGISDMSAVFVAMPLWVMNGLILVAAFVACVVGVSQELMGDSCRVGQAALNALACVLATVVFCSIVVVFEALIVLRIDGVYEASWGQVFVPAFIVAVPVTVTLIIAGISNWFITSRRPEMQTFLRANEPRRLN